MGYQHCEQHDLDATNGCEQCEREGPRDVTVELNKLEANALLYMAGAEEIPESQLLRAALKSYARSALTFDEYRHFFPVTG